MKKLDFWKSQLLQLPDHLFYDLIRTYLGELQTPINKHRMIQQLQGFLTQPAIKDKILSLLDQQDLEVLTALKFHRDPTLGGMARFFTRSTYLEVHHHLLNLEERLLVFQDNAGLYHLNPLLEEDLESRISLDWLCPSQPVRPVYAQSTPLGDYVVLGFLSLIDGESPLKKDNTWKKKTLEKVSGDLGLDPDMLEDLTHLADNLDLITFEEDVVQVHIEPLEDLARMEVIHRFYLYLASMIPCEKPEELAREIAGLLQGLPENRGMSSDSLKGFYRLLHDRMPREELFPLLKRWGLLIEGDKLWQKNVSYPYPLGEENPMPAVIESNFDLRLPPGQPLRKAASVLHLGVIKELDVMPLFEVNKEKVQQAMSRGVTGDEILTMVQDLASPRELPPMVITSLKDWIEDFDSIRIFKGVVLKVEPHRLAMIEHSPEIQNNILSRLGEGLFLMRSDRMTHWRRALGLLTHQAPPPVQGEQETGHRPSRGYEITPLDLEELSWEDRPEDLTQPPQGDLEQELFKKSLDEGTRRELQSRLERRILISPEQIRESAVKLTKRVALGLDFQGKASLISQAIKEEREIIELQMRATKEVFLFAPRKIQKGGNDYDIYGHRLPGEEELHLKLSQVSLVRKVRSGLASLRDKSDQ